MTSTVGMLKKLTLFSIPLILSGLLQQLFNWVDALIVGNILGETALAGVGATSSLYNLFVTSAVGFTSGLSVLFAQQYGEGKHTNNRKLLAEYSVLLTVVFAIASAVGTALAAPALELMDTPEALFDYAKDYLIIILSGIPFLALYNTYSAMLRGMGNSLVPFLSVLISSAVNGVLDYVFIAFLKTGVSGAAAATVISQIAMTVCVIVYTVKKYPELRFSPFRLKELRGMESAGIRYGMPPTVQSSVSSVGNLFLQGFMNGFGDCTVAAITTAYRVDSVLLLPIVNFSTAISTLTAQEIGAGDRKATEKILKIGSAMMSVISFVLTALILLSGRYLLSMFGLSSESEAIGEMFFGAIAPFYIIYGLSMSIKGCLEGKSDLLFSGAVGIISLGVRIICSYAFVGIWGNMVVAYAEAFSWIFMLIVFLCRYFCRRNK